MKELYTIGEMALICGVSVQTLRYYSTLGLIDPKMVDTKTGYRYYSSSSIQLIDRIKYLQKFGISLADIKEIINDGNAETILSYLYRQKAATYEELRKTENTIQEIDWYIDYFDLAKEDKLLSIPYKKKIGKRYAVMVSLLPGESTRDAYIRLLDIRNSSEFADTVYRFQFTYLIDFPSLLEKKFVPNTAGLFLSKNFPKNSPHVRELPGGDYLCFRGRIRTGGWDAEHILRLFDGLTTPQMIIANEHEYNFVNYEDSIFEVQMFLEQVGRN